MNKKYLVVYHKTTYGYEEITIVAHNMDEAVAIARASLKAAFSIYEVK